MKFYRSIVKLFLGAVIALSLSACPGGDDESASDFQVVLTNPANVTEILTPDLIVNITGRVTSTNEIESVIWTNDRGGKGTASGKQQWTTGNIVLQTGVNTITITATDVLGSAASKTLVVERENTTASGAGTTNTKPVAMYSYSSNLSNAAPVKNATISAGPVYFYLIPSDAWVEKGIGTVNYQCCKGVSGPGAGTSPEVKMSKSIHPWTMALSLAAMPVGGTRRLHAYVIHTDGSESEWSSFDFVIGSRESTSNSPPTISGSPPPTATAGIQYNFRPVGTDPDGDTMRFSIRNKPSWASFSEATGRLYGTPTANHVGVYDAIEISVSDGKTSSRLRAFSIKVESFGNGTTTLRWAAPTQRIDNTSLTNLVGFNLYFGQTPGDYGNKIAINNAGLSTYVVENLSAGNWFFVITALDANGIESNPSNQVTRSF